jgi:hypothetical protein
VADLPAFIASIADEITEAVLDGIMPAVQQRIAEFEAESGRIVWSQEEAAAELHMSEEKLADLAKEGLIGYSYAIEPTVWDKDTGRAQNGRRVYLKHHILNYLLAREVVPKTATEADLTPANVYQFNDHRRAA